MAQVKAAMKSGCVADRGLYAAMEHELGWDLTLSEWASLGMPGRLQMLADTQLPMHQLRGLMARLLSHERAHKRSSLLSGLMAQNAPVRLQWCMGLLSQEARNRQVVSSCPSTAPSPSQQALFPLLDAGLAAFYSSSTTLTGWINAGVCGDLKCGRSSMQSGRCVRSRL